jgi:hypothetical protein
MKYAVLILLSAIIGARVGRMMLRRRITRELSKPLEALNQSLANALKQAGGAIAKTTTAPATDTIARGPLPVKAGDTDRALARGDLAFFRDGNWTS